MGKVVYLTLVFPVITFSMILAGIVTYPPANYQGIIALQVRNHPEVVPVLMQRLMRYLSAYPQMSIYKGHLFLVEAHRIRIRK